MATTDIQELTTESEFRAAFSVLKQLRDHLTEEEYLDYLDGMREEDYRLFALLEEGTILSVAGVALRTNFFDILLRLKPEESHGTAPLDWDIYGLQCTTCSCGWNPQDKS